MGVGSRKPPLPAPTESSFLQTSAGSVTGTDLATDVSRRTDRTSYSIPEDGSPVTISTEARKEKRDRPQETTLTRTSHQSQTSLLIEYFEAGKGPNVRSRPSVRVKVTPSAARKIKDTNEHIQITEAGGSRKPSYTRRISLGPKRATVDKQITEGADDRSISSYTSAAEESNLAGRNPPVEIEVLQRGADSDLSSRSVEREQRYNLQNPSELSSIPPDSMLDDNGQAGHMTPKRHRSRSVSREAVGMADNTLKTPSRRRSRSLSKERLTQKVIEKLEGKPRQTTDGRHKHSSKNRSRNVSKEQLVESPRSSRRRSSRQRREEDVVSGAESSLLTSQTRKSGDQYSFRSGTSKSSINNPKLLDTVEDAIRRLILPELTMLKQDQKMNQNRNRFEKDRRDSITSGGSTSREEAVRRPSKYASAPDVKSKPKVVLNRDENNAGTILSGNSIKGRKENKREKRFESPSEQSLRDVSQETVIRDDGKVSKKRSKEGHRIRDVAAAGMAGGILTAAALRHHDSKSSVDKKERSRRSSKSHSRSVSYAGSTEEIFSKHDVPPMPMRSEVHGSELTRDSLLSERTETPATPSSERRRQEIREVSRGSPREVLSPASRTPNRTPLNLRRGLATHHSNLSQGDLSVHSARSDPSLENEKHHSRVEEDAQAGAVVGGGALAADRPSRGRYYDENGDLRVPSRALSPIQSVASYREESEPPNRQSRNTRSSDSLSIQEKHDGRSPALSIKSLSSVASTNVARSKRPKGINLEDGETILEPHNMRDSGLTCGTDSPLTPANDDWYERQHEENDRYRESMAGSSNRDSMVDVRHLTNYTDDSLDAPYLDKVTAAQPVHGMGANPEYIHTPLAVESAVASLHDPSILSVRSRPGDGAYTESLEGARSEERYQEDGNPKGLGLQHAGAEYHNEDSEDADSPRQSIARSISERDEPVHLGASGLPDAEYPMPEIGHGLDSESDLNTNPSIIQGPIGGLSKENRDHWPYQPTPPHNKGEFVSQSNGTSAHENLKAAAAGFMSAAALASQDRIAHSQPAKSREQSVEQSREQSFKSDSRASSAAQYDEAENHDFGPHRESYMSNQPIPTPPMAKDEGYVSAHQPRSPGQTPDLKDNASQPYEPEDIAGFGGLLGEDDPFVGKTHTRHLSGNSHGMSSPLYDSATGGGMDRIQSKDIVALMDHLTVRDAQRNARDTEILVTLVRTAAEMRNSFDEMKKFISDQDEMVVGTGEKQHSRTVQKIISGPRPQPLGTPRFPRQSSAEEDYDEKAAKRQNVFKRALKGLGSRNANDLAKIEDMLQQLLGDVEGLKGGPDVRPSVGESRAESFNSYTDTRAAGPDGYEPEGQAGTSSTGGQSGHFSPQSPSRRPNAMRSQEGRYGSQNRVSTVLEGDEDLEDHEQNVLVHQFENSEHLLTPTKDYTRADSVPLGTPPQVHIPTGAQSNEHTPKSNTDKSRKHKSTSSFFFPKISRWSKTTTSSAGDNYRSSGGPRQRPFSEASHSGSDLNYNTAEPYDPQGDDRLRSNDSFDAANMQHAEEEHDNRPPSPLIPSQVSSQPSEDPKYHAHRNSQNLQHPQPRPGPTHRYQTALESQAHNFGSPISPTSDQWGSNPSLARFAPGVAGNRHSGGAGNLSPISDAGYSETSAAAQSATGTGPPRPPKVKDDGPLVPARPPKVEMTRGGSYEGANGSPRSATGSVPQRKPTGPRPLRSSGNYSPDKVEQVRRNRYRGSPDHIPSSTEDVTF